MVAVSLKKKQKNKYHHVNYEQILQEAQMIKKLYIKWHKMIKIININPHNPERELIRETSSCLHRGGIIVYPTETCYGLGADAFNEDAFLRLMELKKRDSGKTVSLIAGNTEMALSVFKIKNELIIRLAEIFWPGPLTIVAETNLNFAKGIVSSMGMAGVRVSANSIAREISNESGTFITATSANYSKGKECRSAGEAIMVFSDKLDLVVDGGNSPSEGVSTVVSMEKKGTFRILREGVIVRDKLEKILHCEVL